MICSYCRWVCEAYSRSLRQPFKFICRTHHFNDKQITSSVSVSLAQSSRFTLLKELINQTNNKRRLLIDNENSPTKSDWFQYKRARRDRSMPWWKKLLVQIIDRTFTHNTQGQPVHWHLIKDDKEEAPFAVIKAIKDIKEHLLLLAWRCPARGNDFSHPS